MSGIGHIGELQIISQMEKEKFEIYLPMKDKGIDFIAVKTINQHKFRSKHQSFRKQVIFGLIYIKTK